MRTCLLLTTALLATMLACGDESDESSGTLTEKDAASCPAACERQSEVSCPFSNDKDTCLRICEGRVKATPAKCKAVNDRYAACTTTTTYHCDEHRFATPTNCDAERDALLECAWQGVD